MLETSLDARASNDAVSFDLLVENRGDEDVEFSFSDSQRIRVSVVPADVDLGEAPVDVDDVETRWRSDEGQMFMQVLGSETVPAGGRLEYGATWDNPDPGEFRAVGEIVCRERELQDGTTFTV